MKTLASCKPSEFLKQTNRIKKSVEKWLTETDIMNIRKRTPNLLKYDKDADDAKEVYKENQERIRKQARENASAIFDAVCEEHPEETLELLALLCFIEPENADDHTVSEYLEAVTELISSEAVINFFISLGRLGLTRTPTASKA